MSGSRFWIIKQADNFLYYADVRPDRVWTTDPWFAARYRSEEVALNAIIEILGGKGQAIEMTAPAVETPRPPYGPPKFPYGPARCPHDSSPYGVNCPCHTMTISEPPDVLTISVPPVAFK